MQSHLGVFLALGDRPRRCSERAAVREPGHNSLAMYPSKYDKSLQSLSAALNKREAQEFPDDWVKVEIYDDVLRLIQSSQTLQFETKMK